MVSIRSIPSTPSSLTHLDLQWIIKHREDRCTLCGRCTSVCPKEAIFLTYRRQRMPKLDILKKKRSSEYRTFTGIRQRTGQPLHRLRHVRHCLSQRSNRAGTKSQ